MKVFISGGCKNGKSLLAQEIAVKLRSRGRPLYYLATMLPRDTEDIERVERHRRERSEWGFETVEAAADICSSITACDAQGSFLLDSVTALLANVMFKPDGEVVPNAHEAVALDLMEAANSVSNIVLVSDYIYSDSIRYTGCTERYREGLAYIDKKLAGICDAVLEVCGGSVIAYK